VCSDERHRDENKVRIRDVIQANPHQFPIDYQSLVNTPQHGIQLFTAFTPLTSNSLILLFLCYVAEVSTMLHSRLSRMTLKAQVSDSDARACVVSYCKGHATSTSPLE
jgi:hypothetical protein